MSKKVKILLVSILATGIAMTTTGCASLGRGLVDLQSDFGGGLNRTITVYTADGKELAKYTGKIDISQNDGGYVKFDFNGKRYVYYNCFVETIADIH